VVNSKKNRGRNMPTRNRPPRTNITGPGPQ
jgi:hypothetical protein